MSSIYPMGDEYHGQTIIYDNSSNVTIADMLLTLIHFIYNGARNITDLASRANVTGQSGIPFSYL